MIKYRYQIYHFTGEWGWAERYLGLNGTIVAISLIGMLLIFVGVAFPFGAFDKPAPPNSLNSSTTATGQTGPFSSFVNP